MSRLLVVVALIGALVLGGDDPDPGDIPAYATVLFQDEASANEVKAAHARLRSLPGVTRVEEADKAAELVRLRDAFQHDPDMTEALDRIDAETLPMMIRVHFTTRAAMERFAASDAPAELRGMPGVDLVQIPLREGAPSVSNCIMTPAKMYGSPEPLDVRVLHTVDATEAEKQAVRQRLEAVPGRTALRFRTQQDARAEYGEMVADVPDAPALPVTKKLPEAWDLTLRDRAAMDRAVDEKLAEQVCRMPGVSAVFVPPKGF